MVTAVIAPRAMRGLGERRLPSIRLCWLPCFGAYCGDGGRGLLLVRANCEVVMTYGLAACRRVLLCGTLRYLLTYLPGVALERLDLRRVRGMGRRQPASSDAVGQRGAGASSTWLITSVVLAQIGRAHV